MQYRLVGDPEPSNAPSGTVPPARPPRPLPVDRAPSAPSAGPSGHRLPEQLDHKPERHLFLEANDEVHDDGLARGEDAVTHIRG
jgi:hypothetical protein